MDLQSGDCNNYLLALKLISFMDQLAVDMLTSARQQFYFFSSMTLPYWFTT